MLSEERRALIQGVIDELKTQNPEVSPAILRKTVYHVTSIGSRSEEDPDTDVVYPPLLYTEAQAYMDGFSAAIDGDYNIEDVEISPEMEERISTEKLNTFGDFLPSYMLARASHYAAVMGAAQPEYVTKQFDYAMPTIAANGFISGFSAGIKDLDNGYNFRPMNKRHPKGFFDEVAKMSVESVVEGEQSSLKELTSTYMSDISERKISTKSGRSRFRPETEESCLFVYGIGFVHGVMAAISKNPEEAHSSNDASEFKQVEAELRAYCRMNGYTQEVQEKAHEASLSMIDQVGGDQGDEGIYLLNGWGFSDGYASMKEERTYHGELI